MIYQEMKVGAVFWEDEKGHWHKQAVAGRDDPERFGLSLWKVAVQCGMLTCPEVIFISDGGVWCNTVAESYFKDATRILDWYHLSEHVWVSPGAELKRPVTVWEAGRELYANKKEAKRWVENCLTHLHDFCGKGLLAHLQRCRAVCGEQDAEALDGLMGYVRARLEITEYVTYRA